MPRGPLKLLANQISLKVSYQRKARPCFTVWKVSLHTWKVSFRNILRGYPQADISPVVVRDKAEPMDSPGRVQSLWVTHSPSAVIVSNSFHCSCTLLCLTPQHMAAGQNGSWVKSIDRKAPAIFFRSYTTILFIVHVHTGGDAGKVGVGWPQQSLCWPMCMVAINRDYVTRDPFLHVLMNLGVCFCSHLEPWKKKPAFSGNSLTSICSSHSGITFPYSRGRCARWRPFSWVR